MELFLFIAFTHFIALLSPGPDFFLIFTSLLNKGKRAAQFICIGIALGNAIILVLVFNVLFFLDQSSVEFLKYLKWGGAVYLGYLAIQCFLYAKNSANAFEIENDQVESKTVSLTKYMALGIQSSLLNPKNILFYSSLMLLISTEFNGFQKACMSIWMVCVVLGWNIFLVKLLNQKKCLDFIRTYSKWLYYLSGSFFIGFALLLIYS